jgi:sialic acid synthase SpsE
VRDVRRTQALIGHGRKEPAPCEEPGIEWALKSLVAARPLEEGAILTAADLVAKRPGGGVSPNRVVDLIGKRLLRAVEPDSPVQLDDVE